MKRCSIIMHSIGGNCYILGSYFQELLKDRGVDARLYRVKDDDLHIWAERLDTTNEYYEEILALPEAGLETLHKSDMVILNITVRRSRLSGVARATCPDKRSHLKITFHRRWT